MVSKYSRVALWEDILASPESNLISGTQAKQTFLQILLQQQIIVGFQN